MRLVCGKWRSSLQRPTPQANRSSTEPLPIFQATCDVTDLKHALSSLFPVIPAKLLHNTAVLSCGTSSAMTRRLCQR